MPYHRILIGTDLSESSRVAADTAPLFGSDRAVYRVVHVAPMPPGLRLERARDRFAARAKELAEKLDAWTAKTRLPRAESMVALGSVSRELGGVASGMEADLIAVGHRGESKLQQLLIGSTARAVLRMTFADTLVARPSSGDPALRRIVIATDFQPASVRAAERALDLAQAHGATLSLAHVIDPSIWYDVWLDDAPASVLKEKDWLETTVTQKLEAFDRDHLGSSATRVVLHGKPAHALAAHASQMKADLVVIGTHGATRLERALIGSNAESMIEHAPVSVLLVR